VKKIKFKKSEKGAAAVEFALVLPLLLVLVFGIIEFGFLIYNKAMITNASREGARFGIVFRPDKTGLNTIIENTVSAYLEDNSNNSFLVSFGTATPTTTTTPVDASTTVTGDYLTVTVSYPYQFLVVPNLITQLTGTVTLTGVTTMRVE
jgi:Flp pilus assembly protein TadG